MKALVFAAALTVAAQAQTPNPAPAPAPAPNPNTRFIPALQASGANNTASIVFTGSGALAFAGADGKPGVPGPVTRYSVMVNYGLLSTRTEIERPASPKRVVQSMSNGTAWDVIDGKKPVPNPGALAERRRLFYMTPAGAIKAAFDAAGKRTMADEVGSEGKTVTTFTYLAAGSKYKAYLDDESMVTKVQTMPGDPVLGDTIVEFLYTDYKDVDTIKQPTAPPGSAASYHDIMFPMHVVEKVNGQTVLDLSITSVRPNAGEYIEVPDSVAQSTTR